MRARNSMAVTCSVGVRFAVECGNKIFAIGRGAVLGEAAIAAVELASYLGCDLTSAVSFLQTPRAMLRFNLDDAVFAALDNFAAKTLSPVLTAEHFPGKIYCKSSMNNWFIESPKTTFRDVAECVGHNEFELFYLVNGNAGEVFHGAIPGVSFCFHSRERGRHSEPHVHASVEHRFEYSIDIKTGCYLEGDPLAMKAKMRKKIDKLILEKRIELLKAWNTQTDGLKIDLDAMLGQTECDL